MRNLECDTAGRGAIFCEECLVRRQGLFADLAVEDLRNLHSPIGDVALRAGDSLYQRGDSGDAVYTVRQGMLKLEQYMSDGSKRILNLLWQGDLAGLEIMATDCYEHTAIALEPSTVCRIPKELVVKLAPKLHDQITQKWYHSLVKTQECLRDLGSGSARQRVARLFLLLPEADNGNECHLFAREDVGALLGVTTETASRAVAEFKRAGVVREKSPNIFIRNRAKLETIAGGRYHAS